MAPMKSKVTLFLSFLILPACGASPDEPGSAQATGGVTVDGGPAAAGLVPNPSCMAITPCGGDVVGTWDFETLCSFWRMPGPDWCPSAVMAFSPSPLGTFTYRIDGTYEVIIQHDFVQTGTYPSS